MIGLLLHREPKGVYLRGVPKGVYLHRQPIELCEYDLRERRGNVLLLESSDEQPYERGGARGGAML